MSTYESYDCVCSSYDKGRVPAGMELYRSFLSTLSQPLDQIHVLDAGCGTGNYSVELLRSGVGKVTMLDASEGMLDAARRKIVDFGEERYKIVQSNLPDLPFDDDTFDAVMFNMVLHHLDDGSDHGFKNHVKTFAESFRVLKPGGLLILQCATKFQVRECLWWNAFIPVRAVKAFCDRIIDVGQTKTMLKETGFRPTLQYNEMDIFLIPKDTYMDVKGIFRKEWRDLYSGFSLCNDEELEAMLKRVSAMLQDGTFYKEFNKLEENRRNAGSTTVLISYKPDANSTS